MSEELDAVLLEISLADSQRALRLAGQSARGLSVEEKEIARWSYAYAAEQLGITLRKPDGAGNGDKQGAEGGAAPPV